MTKKKTPEQIMKANLAKSLNRLKNKVADKEEIWLEFVYMVFPCICGENPELINLTQIIDKTIYAANSFLDRYEERWGK